MRPFSRNLVHYNRHWFWDYGNGELGNNGIHYIDLARWGLNRQLPAYIYSRGGRFGYRDPAETPNTQLTTYRFEDGTELITEIRGRFTNSEGEHELIEMARRWFSSCRKRVETGFHFNGRNGRFTKKQHPL